MGSVPYAAAGAVFRASREGATWLEPPPSQTVDTQSSRYQLVDEGYGRVKGEHTVCGRWGDFSGG